MKKRRSGALSILLAAALLCALMLTGCGAPQAPTEPQITYEPEFEKILAMVGLTGDDVVTQTEDTAYFAGVMENGDVDIIKVTFEDDVITEIYESIYYMTTEENQEFYPVLQSFAEDMKAQVEEEGRLTVDWEKREGSFRISCHMMHLEKSENVKTLLDQQLLILEPNDDGLLHFTNNLIILKAQDYVEQSFYRN